MAHSTQQNVAHTHGLSPTKYVRRCVRAVRASIFRACSSRFDRQSEARGHVAADKPSPATTQYVRKCVRARTHEQS